MEMSEANRRRRPNARNYGKQKCAHDVIAGLQKGDEMGEANRRRGAQSTVIKGPFSYEVCLFGLDQIMAGGLIELLSDGPPSPRGVTIIKATANLAARMRDPGRPKMLCMSCDHEFERDEHPAEIAVALPWASVEHPHIVSPICAACAAADDETKAARLKEQWAKVMPPGATILDQAGSA
jgi:hypothetical protein